MLSCVRNKANSRRCRWDEALGTGALGVVQTKPILKGDGSQQGVAWAHCAKQSQSAPAGQGRPSPRPEALTLPPPRETSAPNKANLAQRQVRTRAGKAIGPAPAGDESCETKPIRPEATGRASPVGKRSCGELYMYRPMAKQSQFPALPAGTRSGEPGPWGVVQTKPISKGDAGQRRVAWAYCAKQDACDRSRRHAASVSPTP
jgi:hypothetical protein